MRLLRSSSEVNQKTFIDKEKKNKPYLEQITLRIQNI